MSALAAEGDRPLVVTPINSEDRLVQATFAKHLEQVLDWESVYAWNKETFGPDGTLAGPTPRRPC